MGRTEQNEQTQQGQGARDAAGRRRLAAAVVACVVLVAVVVALAAAFTTGVLPPPGTAAQFEGNHYISERQVNDYVESYRTQSVGAEASDEAWALFLAGENLTPKTLRDRVIQQLVIDEMVRIRASEEGVQVDEAEFQAYMTNFKNTLAFGDDEIYRTTLEQQGQTVQQAEEGFRNLFLQRALFQKTVPVPEPTASQLESGVENAYPSGLNAVHLYRFCMDGLDEGGSYEKLETVQNLRKELLESAGLDAAAFERFVVEHSNDEQLVSERGDDGWNLDLSDRSDKYRAAAEQLAQGELSNVFADTDGYAFLWADTAYHAKPDDGGHYDLEKMPAGLRAALKEGVAKQLWELDCQVYLQQLFSESGTVVYAMPEEVPYNVNMDLAGASTTHAHDADGAE